MYVITFMPLGFSFVDPGCKGQTIFRRKGGSKLANSMLHFIPQETGSSLKLSLGQLLYARHGIYSCMIFIKKNSLQNQY
jgi:hypothetical protein